MRKKERKKEIERKEEGEQERKSREGKKERNGGSQERRGRVGARKGKQTVGEYERKKKERSERGVRKKERKKI